MLPYDVASLLAKSRRKTFKNGLEGFVGSCPCSKHTTGDTSLSLAVFIGDDDWLKLKCAGGCTEPEIMSALGITDDDRKPDSKTNNHVEPIIYRYTDEDGNYVFEKHRIPLGNGKKDFKLKTRDASGKIEHTLHGLNGWGGTMYNAPKVKAARHSSGTVYLCEGEKACDAMTAKGFVATCQPLGADISASKWSNRHTEALSGINVVIVADRDEVGEGYAASVAAKLLTIAASVRVVQSKTDGAKHDAYDHFMAGFGVEDFIEPKSKFKIPSAGLRSFASVERQSVSWLWHPYLPLGGLSILVGDPGVGKSTFAYALASMVSNGRGACGFPEQEKGDVLLYCLEDDPSKVIRGRLDQHNANLAYVHDGTYDEKYNPEGIEPPMTLDKMHLILAAAKSLPNVKLIVFDPIVEWFPENKNINRGNETREILKIFRSLSEDCNCSVLILGHPNKGNGGSLLYKVSGSIDFSAIVRSGLYAAKLPETEDCAIFHFKQNWGRKGSSICYNIDGDTGEFKFTGQQDVTEDMLHASNFPGEKPVTAKQRQAAVEWLEATITETPIRSEDVFAGAKAAGFSGPTLKRAKAECHWIRCKPVKDGETTKWYWSRNQLSQPAHWAGLDDDPFRE